MLIMPSFLRIFMRIFGGDEHLRGIPTRDLYY
jgi:hypothetical protein